MKRETRWPVVILTALFVLTFVFSLQAAELKQAQVQRVVDGDTIDVRTENGLKVTVRYIGIDTPETHGEVEEYGKEATNYNQNLVAEKTVWLEVGEEAKDKYGRLLAYVYLDPAKKSLVQAILVAQGYAEVMTIPPNDKLAETFEELASDARKGERGLWSEGNSEDSNPEELTGVADCVEVLNNSTREDFEAISGIGEGIAKRLIDAQPFSSLDSVEGLRNELMEVSYVGETRSEDILKAFCPELLE